MWSMKADGLLVHREGRTRPLCSLESIGNLCHSIQGSSGFANHKQLKNPSQVSKTRCYYDDNFAILCGLAPLSLERYAHAGFSGALPVQGHEVLFPSE